MDEGSRDKLDYRKDTYLKDDLFNKIAVFEQCIRPVRQSLRKIEPGNKARREVQYVRNLDSARYHLRSGVKYDIEYDPVHHNGNYGLNERPDETEIGSRITLLKIVFGKLPYKGS